MNFGRTPGALFNQQTPGYVQYPSQVEQNQAGSDTPFDPSRIIIGGPTNGFVGPRPLAPDKTYDMFPSEIELCQRLFAPMPRAPQPGEVRQALLEPFNEKIPIQRWLYHGLEQQVCGSWIGNYFVAAPEDGSNYCPILSTRVCNAMFTEPSDSGTEAAQQHFMNSFLFAILGTGIDILKLNGFLDRSRTESTLTVPGKRLNFLMMLDKRLVFKGEESRNGKLKSLFADLLEKTLVDEIARTSNTGNLKYLLCYAKAGNRVLFSYIDYTGCITECSDELDISKLWCRVYLIVILVNVFRISRTV